MSILIHNVRAICEVIYYLVFVSIQFSGIISVITKGVVTKINK